MYKWNKDEKWRSFLISQQMILNKATGALVAKKNVNGLVARQFFHEILIFFIMYVIIKQYFKCFIFFSHCYDNTEWFHSEPNNEKYFVNISCTLWWTGNNLAALEIMQHICKMVYVLSSWRVICKQYNVPLIDINEVSLQYCNIHRSVHFFLPFIECTFIKYWI